MNNADEPDYQIPDPKAEARETANQDKAAEKLDQLWESWPKDAEGREQRFAGWLQAMRERALRWTPLVPQSVSSNSPTLEVLNDGFGTVVASGDTTKHDTYRIEIPASSKPITALRLEALPDDALPAQGPGLTYYEGRKGDFFLSEFKVLLGSDEEAQVSKIARATESYAKNQFNQKSASASLTFDGDLQTGWSTHQRNGERHVATFMLEQAVEAGQPLNIEMHFGRHFASSLGRFRLSVTDIAGAAEAIALPFDDDGVVEALLLRPDGELDDEDRMRLRHAFLLDAPEQKKGADEIRKLRRRREHATTLVLRERAHGRERPTHRHHRGEFLQPRERVRPGLPEVLQVEDAPTNRLGFATWLVSRGNPLTARVVVNRYWAAFFGRGIVETVDDFGAQGATPTHPELLDWLAVDFMESGWKLKGLHRNIVMSATYRQSSHVSPDALARDPANRWLARGAAIPIRGRDPSRRSSRRRRANSHVVLSERRYALRSQPASWTWPGGNQSGTPTAASDATDGASTPFRSAALPSRFTRPLTRPAESPAWRNELSRTRRFRR